MFLGLAVAMAICALLGFLFEHVSQPPRPIDHDATLRMLISSAVTGVIAGVVWWWGRRATAANFTRREATVTVNVIWFGVAVLGAIPYVLGAGLGPVDAFFEAASGFTTTGATIVTDIEGTLSHTVLLWRSLTQWLGGMGIVVLFIAIFPSLGVSGKHMFRSEVPGHSAEGLQPRIAETSVVLWRFYLAFTAAEIAILWWLGMDLFEATNHAWTTMSTGGFSTRNASVAGFDSASIELVISVFMLFAGVNFGLYYAIAATGRVRDVLRSLEFRVYLGLVLVSTAILTVVIRVNHDGSWLQSARNSVFTVATTITSTGYGVDDYMAYPSPALLVIILLMFVGGMSGSTAGGIKISRLIILFETLVMAVRRSVRPQVVHVVRLDNKVLDTELLVEVASFFFLYMTAMGFGTLVVAVTDGVPVPTLFGAMLTSLSNMGPAPFYQGADHFAPYSPTAKGLFAVAMLVGRLEFFTVVALLLPGLWKR